MILQNSERGQGLVEYGFIIVLVAVVILTVLLMFSPIVGNTYSEINTEPEGLSNILQML